MNSDLEEYIRRENTRAIVGALVFISLIVIFAILFAFGIKESL